MLTRLMLSGGVFALRVSALTWGTTKVCFFAFCFILGSIISTAFQFLFVFGDSYTSNGFNISAGIDSPVPESVSHSH